MLTRILGNCRLTQYSQLVRQRYQDGRNLTKGFPNAHYQFTKSTH